MIREVINKKEFEITTDRLKIIPVAEDEAEIYFKEFTAEIAQYQYPDPFTNIEATKKFIGDFTWAKEVGLHLVCSIFNEYQNFVGSVEIYKLDHCWPELGIWICKDYWRQGYAYETLNGVIDFFKQNMDIEGFIYEADRRNPSSIQLIEKLQGIEIGYQEVHSDSGSILELKKYAIV